MIYEEKNIVKRSSSATPLSVIRLIDIRWSVCSASQSLKCKILLQKSFITPVTGRPTSSLSPTSTQTPDSEYRYKTDQSVSLGREH
jgi:hypothetical protein